MTSTEAKPKSHRPPYRVGDWVKATYLGEHGTTLAPVQVTGIEATGKAHIPWRITFEAEGATRAHHVNHAGVSDFVLPYRP